MRKLLTYLHSAVIISLFAIGCGFCWHLGASLAFTALSLLPVALP